MHDCKSVLDIDCSWNIFFLHNSSWMLIKQLINLRKVRTEKLKFRTDLQDLLFWVAACQKILKLKTEACPFNAGIFWPCVGFQTLHFICNLAANVDCDQFRFMPWIGFKFCASPWETPFERQLGFLIGNLSRCLPFPKTGCKFWSAALPGFDLKMHICFYVLFFNQKPMMIERLSKEISKSLVSNSSENFISQWQITNSHEEKNQ